jgi:hypothetical protein
MTTVSILTGMNPVARTEGPGEACKLANRQLSW